MIKKQYSNDDQMAIMLNAQLSEEDKVYYNKMQEWREFSGYIANLIDEKGQLDLQRRGSLFYQKIEVLSLILIYMIGKVYFKTITGVVDSLTEIIY